MTNIYRFERKDDESVPGGQKPSDEQSGRVREKRKPSRPVRGQRDQPGREGGEMPRGTTIPPYPKESIDD